MDPSRSPEDIPLPNAPPNYVGSSVPNSYYEQFLANSVRPEVSQALGNSVYSTSPESIDGNELPIGGYNIPWESYLGTFGFPVESLSTSEQLTPEQLAELDQYLNALSEQNNSPVSQCATGGSYPAPSPSSNYGLDGTNVEFSSSAETGRQIYTDALNQWSAGINLSDNSQFSEGNYNPFGMPNNVFPRNESTSSNSFKEDVSFLPTEVVNSKPSFAEVAKNNPVLGRDNGPKVISQGKNVHSDKKDTKVFHDHHRHLNTYPGQSKSNSSVKINTKKGRSAKMGNLQRSKSMPVEPAEIKPDSRYGLDTFDERGITKEVTTGKTVVSCGNSRKNSTSSVSSSISGLEDVALNERQTCESNHPGSDCDRFGATFHEGLVNNNNKEKKISHKKTNVLYDKKENACDSSSINDEIYFDPRRIFQDSKEKTSKSVQTNNEDYVPNNKQKIQPDKESLLNKEKPKASVKSGSTKYINNDLRDVKKHVNIEQEKERVSKGQNGREVHSKTYSGIQGRNRVKLPKSETVILNKNGSKNNNKKEKNENGKYIMGEWLLLVYGWLLWSCGKLVNFMWNLLKLVLSVVILLLALLAHYSIILCVKLWSFLQHKIPYLRKQREQTGFDWSTPMSPSRPKQYGLKENIILPGTGNEAMKRLLSCKGKDPYSILGVRGDASDEDIKKYYRKQAVLVHPDKNKQPGAEEAFKILGHAFDLIGTVEKRKDYDSHLEMKDAEAAMQEFADLLTKLHDKMQEASNLLRCDHCGGKHKRVPTDRPMYSARFCDRCHTKHPAKEGDVWAESKMLGFLWHYYACMEGKVYDITEWASCKHDNFKSMQANAHQVIYRLSTGGGKSKSGGASRSGDANLEDFLNTLFHTASSNLSADSPSGGAANNPGQSNVGPTSGNAKASKTGRKKKKKH